VINRFPSIWAWIERLRSRRLRWQAIRHNGLTRHYLVYVPRHRRGPLPLVLLFHGGAGHPQAFARVTGMHTLAERAGFVVVYPAGTQGRRGMTWNGRMQRRADIDDVGFVRAMLNALQTSNEIDRRRVYAAGMSVGGSLVYELACTMSEHFAAVAVVAGVMTSENCDPARPVPLLHIHGTDDQRVPLHGGRGRRTARHNTWPPVESGIERWCEINRCSRPGNVIRSFEGMVGRRYTGAADVELWLVEGGRHVWPGGTPGWRWRWRFWRPRRSTIAAFSASEMVWNFFAAHPAD
jgi:polyhydroxybutyrate depolymerase